MFYSRYIHFLIRILLTIHRLQRHLKFIAVYNILSLWWQRLSVYTYAGSYTVDQINAEYTSGITSASTTSATITIVITLCVFLLKKFMTNLLEITLFFMKGTYICLHFSVLSFSFWSGSLTNGKRMIPIFQNPKLSGNANARRLLFRDRAWMI